jgi:hypothetical protein
VSPTDLFRLHYDAVFIISRLVGRAEFAASQPHVDLSVPMYRTSFGVSNMYTSSAIRRLLDLLALLCELPLTSLLGSLWSRLGIHDIVPPSKAARIVADESLVVSIVMIGTGPERQEIMQAPWKFVAAVSIDSLEETEDNPEIHGQDMELTSDQNPNDWYTNSAKTENHDFNGRCILGSQSEWSRVLMVDFVDVLVERAPVQCAVDPVVPSILKDKKYSDVESHCLPTRERNACVHAAEFRHRVEKPDLRKLDGEVAEENKFRALPLLGHCGDLLVLDLVLVEIGDSVDDDPRDASSKIHNLMHNEAHDSGREDIILHVLVPTLRWLLAFAMWRSGAIDLQPRDARTNLNGHCISTAHYRYQNRYLEPSRR